MWLGITLLRPVDRALASTLAEARLGRVAIHLPWAWVEDREGRWDPRGTDRLLAPLREAGLPIHGILGPAMPHLLPLWLHRSGGVDRPDFIERFADYCARVADRERDIRSFRIEDEVHSACWEAVRTRRRVGRAWWSRSFADRLLSKAITAVRAVRPDATLELTLSARAPWTGLAMRRLVALAPAIDEVGLGHLAHGLLPGVDRGETLGEAVAQARARLPWPVGVSRLGHPVDLGRRTPRLQADYLVRASQSVEAAGGAGLTWASLRDQAHDDPSLGYWPPAWERSLGLRSYDGTPRVGWEELRRLSRGGRF